MCLYINIKCLWLQLWVRRIIDARYCVSGCKMMKIWSKFMEFCSCCLLLQFWLFECGFPWEILQLLTYLLILLLNVLQVALSSVEIMLVLPTIISAVVFLDYFSLFSKKFTLFLLVFIFLSVHKLATANIASPDSLDFLCCFFLILELPFYFEHAPVLLYD